MEYMEVLVEPANPDLDIVFVHGLNPSGSKDHARSTWTHSANSNDVFWPDTLLPADLPSARIILFAYNSSVETNASNTSVHSHAETLLNRLNLKRQKDSEKHRRLIFIAHSMGGLLVKQALVEAGIHSSNYGCIRASTKGLVFFATPHAGGNLAGLADVAANFFSAMTGSAKNTLLKTLKQNSLLNEISKDHFRPQLGDYEVLTFIESKKMDVHIGKKRTLRIVPQITSMYIVDAESAKLGVASEMSLHLCRNHSDICKFSGPEDDEYELVSGNLQLMAEKVQGKEVRCTECNNSSQARMEPIERRYRQIPYASSIPGAPPSSIGFTGAAGRVGPPINSWPLRKPFIGRERLVKEILETWQEWTSPTPRRISLSGLGGVGKTELSRSIIDQVDQRPWKIWLNAGSYLSLETDLRKAAQVLRHELLRADFVPTQPNTVQDSAMFYTAYFPIKDLVELLRAWLSTPQLRGTNMQEVLVVLDDVDGLESSELLELSQMVTGGGIDIIFSTRDPSIADRTSYLAATNFDVPPLEEDQARELLTEEIEGKRPTAVAEYAPGPAETKLLTDVATRFGFLPAALINGSYYLTIFGDLSAVPFFLRQWNSTALRRQILGIRVGHSRYIHSMLSSYQLSLERLWRNTNAEDPALYFCCLNMLRLLSAMKISCFVRAQLESLCDLLRLCLQNISLTAGENYNLHLNLCQLSEDANKAFRCATELVNVSLLTTQDGIGTLVLNQSIKACVMLRANSNWPLDGGLRRDEGLNEAEMPLLEEIARHISETWAPCLLSPNQWED